MKFVKKIIKYSILWVSFIFCFVTLVLMCLLLLNSNTSSLQNVEVASPEKFSFYVVSDMRKYSGDREYDTDEYFAGALKAIKERENISAEYGEFMIIPGDLDPVSQVSYSIDKYLGENYIWLSTVGNHELPEQGEEGYEGENIDLIDNQIKDSPFEINHGPDTCPDSTYSYDYKGVHFVMLNQYCDDVSDRNTDGKMSEVLLAWLEKDLENYSEERVLVFGHEPAYPIEDIDSKRLRHEEDSLNQYSESRDKFWNMLNQYNVDAYTCGHTHNLSMKKFDNVWQIDSGHARGIGDTGSPSTYIKVNVGEEVEFVVYRMEDIDNGYEESYRLNLTSGITPTY